MYGYDNNHVTIRRCDNGWIVEWCNPIKTNYQKTLYEQAGNEPVTSGTEIFTKEKDMLVFVKGKI